jgi:hypothetical protein
MILIYFSLQIMIRNIPNKITSVCILSLFSWPFWPATNTEPVFSQQDELKNILDESSFGKYDFLYLRMGKSDINGVPIGWLLTHDYQTSIMAASKSEIFMFFRLASFSNTYSPLPPSVGYAFVNFGDVGSSPLPLCWSLVLG